MFASLNSRAVGAAVLLTSLMAAPRASPTPARSVTQDSAKYRMRSIQLALSAYGNPAALIRAANLLRPQDKDRALLAVCVAVGSRFDYSEASPGETSSLRSSLPLPLRRFMEDADTRPWTADPGQLLVLAAFTPADDVLPPSRFVDQDRPCSLMAPISKTWPLVFIGGVPFDLTGVEAWAIPQPERGQRYGNSLVARSFFDFLAWAHLHATSEQELLVPHDGIFDVVDAWLSRFSASETARQVLGADGIAEFARRVRGQSIRMTEGVLDSFIADPALHPAPHDHDLSPLWPAYCEAARARKLRWNRETQFFELGG